MTGEIVTGVIVAVVTVVLTLWGQRWVSSWGGVRCDIHWQPTRGEGGVDSPGGPRFLERQLTATFENRKDVPVTVREMRVDFYKGTSPWPMRNARTSSSRAPTEGRDRSSC